MIAALLLLAQTAVAAPAPAVSGAIVRALPTLERSAKSFVAQRSCVSCHHNILPILTLRLAASRGLAVDTATLADVERKTFRELTGARAFDEAVQGATVGDPTPNDSWLLIAAGTAGLAPDLTSAVVAKRIASWQHDGHWTTSDFRPPHSSSLFTSTATAVRALRLYLPGEMREARDRAIDEARRWLLKTPPQSTEDATFRLLGLVWAGAPRAEVDAAAGDVRKLQRMGGGWAQLPAYPPDAYSTGEALYALHEAGTAIADVRWQRGIAFLLSTQAADGTWHVRTRMISPAEVSPPYFSTGFPYKKDEYLSYAASSWATLALLSALPEKAGARQAAPTTAAVFPADPAFRAALFDTSARFAASAAGKISLLTVNGTSLLMAAAGDADKVTWLLANGADATYRAPSGYDATTIAASYRGTTASIAALVAAGADVQPPDTLRIKHSPLLFASMSGDLETVSLLLARGANPNRRDSPLSEAITFGRADVVRALIGAGAKVDLVERTGVNLIHWATLTNRPDVIADLARAGADVNAVDAAGFTPLMYAATVDFGDTATLRALISAGADKTIRNSAGRTPLQQARHLGLAHLASALE